MTDNNISQFTSKQRNSQFRPKNLNKTIDKEHPEFELTIDMMLGIRTCISRAQNEVAKEKLSNEDFSEVYSLRMPSEGSNTTPPHKMRDFKFKDYAPKVFRHLRQRFGIDAMDYMLTVCGNCEFLEFISNSKSGQFFFYTHDRQFMIKTQTDEESKLLRSILPQYYEHVMDNQNTLITRFYGMHRVKPHNGSTMHFVIMGSVFYTDKFVHEVYDLKGSTQGRSATPAEKAQPCPVLKDNDWTESNMKLNLGQTNAQMFIEQLEKDTNFLKNMNIMDYSLLMGIHYPNKPIPHELLEEIEVSSPPPNAAAPPIFSPSEKSINEEKSEKSLKGNKKPSLPLLNFEQMNKNLSAGSPLKSSIASTVNVEASHTHSDVVVDEAVKEEAQAISGDETEGDAFVKNNFGIPSQVQLARRRQSNFGIKKNRRALPTVPAAVLTSVIPDILNEAIIEEKDSLLISNTRLNSASNARNGNVVDNHEPPEEFVRNRARSIISIKSVFNKNSGGISSADDTCIYFVGIIDILQLYNATKKAEHFFKSFRFDGDAISSVDSDFYANRMINFLKKSVN